MQSRRPVLAAVLVFISLPVVVAVVEAVSFRVLNRNNGTIVSSGETRELLHVPGSYDRTKPIPLVISMHAAALWPAAQRDTSLWNKAADEHGFIVVYPSGASGDGPRVWHMDRAGLARDVRFISDLIDRIQGTYNIDPARIYADGLSNGGGMAFVLSCTLADRIAAVGMVASAQLLPWSWCTGRRPVPMIAIHGTADRITPYNGGSSWAVPRPLPDIPTWARLWARRNRCGANPVETSVAAQVTRLEYPNCADEAAVVLYTIHGGGHTWPGGEPLPEWLTGANTRNIDATNELWQFFRAHPLHDVRGSITRER